MCVYLPKCYHNSVSITQKHPKVVFSFANSLLKNQIIEWWKQNLKTQPNRLSLCGTHQFWVMSDENRVMGDENCKSKQPLIILKNKNKNKTTHLLGLPLASLIHYVADSIFLLYFTVHVNVLLLTPNYNNWC